jgi:hypothetical protein
LLDQQPHQEAMIVKRIKIMGRVLGRLLVEMFIHGGKPMKLLEDMTQPELRELTTGILDSIQVQVPDNCAFTVLFWPIGTHGIAQYGSNCARPDMIKALRETADRLERRQDVTR